MQSKTEQRKQASALRQKGLSYSEIQKSVAVSQASLSLWLKNIPLSEKQRERLSKLSLVGQQAGAQARHHIRLDRLEKLKIEVAKEFPKLVTDSFFVFGLALYWAEGSKQKPWNLGARAQFSNSDPTLILLMRNWFEKFCASHFQGINYRLHIHITADQQRAQDSWAKILNVDPNIIAITLKRNEVRGRHKHDNYKGLIKVTWGKSIWLNRRIDLWTQLATDYWLNKD